MTKVIVDGVKMAALYAFFTESVTTLGEYNGLIDKKITELGNYWQGLGYNELSNLYSEVKLSMETLVTEMDNFSTNVDTVGKNGQKMYEVIKASLASVSAIVNVAFDEGTKVSGEFDEIYGVKTNYTEDEMKKAIKDIENALLNLQADIDVLSAELNDNLVDLAALEVAYKAGEISYDDYVDAKEKLTEHRTRVQEQLNFYKEALDEGKALTANSDKLDLLHWFTSPDQVEGRDGKIEEATDGFLHWGKDIDLLNEGISDFHTKLAVLEPTSVVCDTAAVNGLYGLTTDYLYDSFSEGAGVSQTHMNAAYLAAGNSKVASEDGTVEYFNSQEYTNRGKQALADSDFSINLEVKGPDDTSETITVNRENMNYTSYSHVFTQDNVYESLDYSTDVCYTDPNTNQTYDSVRVTNSDGSVTYMSYSQYQIKTAMAENLQS